MLNWLKRLETALTTDDQTDHNKQTHVTDCQTAHRHPTTEKRLMCVGLYGVVEKEGFIHMLQTAESRFDIPSRKFLTETAVPQLYQETKRKVASALN